MSQDGSALKSAIEMQSFQRNSDPEYGERFSSADESPYASSDVSEGESLPAFVPVTDLEREDTTGYLPLTTPGRGSDWLQDASGQRKTRIELALHNARTSGMTRWLSGPSPPRKYTIKPCSPEFQNWPSSALARCLRGSSVAIAGISVVIVWLLAFTTLLAISAHHGEPQPVRLACDTRLWPDTTFCGLNGEYCMPFEEASFPFSCPSNCASVQVLEPHTVGNQEIIYRSMVIGGPSTADENNATYRGDSFICASAIHAGIVSNRKGGCGILARKGEHRHFTASYRNGISSIASPTSFPLSFSLAPADDSCIDPQWRLFTVSVLSSILISLLTSSSSFFFAAIFVIVFFQVALASDPPFFPDFPSVLSMAFERFLPTAFVGWLVYRYCVRHTLHGLQANGEKTILWLGGCWVGALNNYTFDKIPISRLTPHDLHQQPGAIVALIIIVLIITAIAIGQAWAFRIEGRLLHYLFIYLVLAVTLAGLAAIPNLQLRLHHYILALLLLPGTSLQTRPSLLYQGILVGLLLNGTARWGYASILQTPAALLGDGQLGSALPAIAAPTITLQNISFAMPTLAAGFDGISILVNDVERFRESASGAPLQPSFTWTRPQRDDPDPDPAFFRFAFTGTRPLGGIWFGDYTEPATWFANGTWVTRHTASPRPSRIE